MKGNISNNTIYDLILSVHNIGHLQMGSGEGKVLVRAGVLANRLRISLPHYHFIAGVICIYENPFSSAILWQQHLQTDRARWNGGNFNAYKNIYSIVSGFALVPCLLISERATFVSIHVRFLQINEK